MMSATYIFPIRLIFAGSFHKADQMKRNSYRASVHEPGAPVLLVWILVLLFAGLMSLPFLVPHCGFVSLFGIVPLLIMERIVTLSGMRRGWIFHFSAFVLWNAATTFWVCNATIGGGIFAIVANAFQMSVIFGLFRYSRKYFGGVLPYVFLAAMWIAWERAYFDAQISWPWLVLGNSFARSIQSVQWYEYTGQLGGSLWIWISNLFIFGIMVALSDGRWAFRWNIKAKVASLSGLVIVIAAPLVLSKVMYERYSETSDPLEVLVLQPNIDPYNKFEAMSQDRQNALLMDQMRKALPDRRADNSSASADSLHGNAAGYAAPLLAIAPETFTNDVITNNVQGGRTFRAFSTFLEDYPGVSLIFGASSYTYVYSPEAPSYTARRIGDKWYESHNSALVTDGTGRYGIYHKSRLVPAVEMTPYPAFFCKVDDMLGGVMGRCIGQDEVSLLDVDVSQPVTDSLSRTDAALQQSVPVGCAVCYESVYGEYFSEYVKAGAKLMTIITNDAWWKDTPGYRQHLSYASLRAIETRRDIARSANTGISAIINQRGDIVASTSWWQPAVIRGKVNLNDSMTFYVRHGDITGRVSTFVFVLLLLALVIRRVTAR